MRALGWSVACAVACVSLVEPSAAWAQDAPSVGEMPPVDAGPTPAQPAPPAAQPVPPPAAQPSAPPPGGYWYNLPYASQAPMPYAPYGQAPAEPRMVRRWYGWQTLLADGLTSGVFVIAAAQDRSDDQAPYLVVGTLGWFFAPPIIHWGHGNVAEGFASLGLRVAPVLIALMAAASCYSGGSGSGDEGACAAMIIVAVASIPAAVIIDAAVLAYDEREERPTTAFSLAFGPWHDARRDAWGLGLGAAF